MNTNMKNKIAGWICSLVAANSLCAEGVFYNYDSLNRLTNVLYSDGSGESYSYDSSGNRLRRTTGAATTNLDTTSPSAPTNLVQVTFVPSQLSIVWNRAFDTGGSGLAGYQVYVNGSPFAVTTSTNFVLSGLTPNMQYCLSVVAFDGANNLSDQSASICVTTPVFEPPYLIPLGFTSGQFHIGATGGTEGPYDVDGSSDLLNWEKKATVWLPFTNGYFIDSNSNVKSPYFYYRFRWSTNTP